MSPSLAIEEYRNPRDEDEEDEIVASSAWKHYPPNPAAWRNPHPRQRGLGAIVDSIPSGVALQCHHATLTEDLGHRDRSTAKEPGGRRHGP